MAKRILIAESNYIVRRGLRRLLTEFLGEVELCDAALVDDVIELVRQNTDLDAVFIDPGDEAKDWPRAITTIHALLPKAAIVVLHDGAARNEILRAIERGAAAYIPKSTSAEEFCRALKIIFERGVYLPQDILRARDDTEVRGKTLQNGAPDVLTNGLTRLTARQNQVLACLAQGCSNAEIADQLSISVFTVRVHVSAVLKVLHVANRTQAALMAQRYLE